MSKLLTLNGYLDLESRHHPVIGSLVLEDGNILHGYTWMIGSSRQFPANCTKMALANGHINTETEAFTLEHQMHLFLTYYGSRRKKTNDLDDFDYVLELASPRSKLLDETGLAGCYEGSWSRLEKKLLRFNDDRAAFLAAFRSTPCSETGYAKIYLHEH